ncbi:hypothetical protein F5884DRAFT_784282 [Xylogone sp. PMI_703]|nr:hypothetical protein F5884DRAFT_784282 [Xylogone sp. PMI_703]
MPVNTKSKTQRKKQTKKQTQLTFDPVQVDSSSSSSAFPTARVRYSAPGLGKTRSAHTQYAKELSSVDGPSKQYPAVVSSPPDRQNNAKLPFKPLPTPVKSSQIEDVSITPVVQIDSSDDSDTDIKPNVPSHRSLNGSLSSHTKKMVKRHPSAMFAGPDGSKRATATSSNVQLSDSDGSPGEDEVAQLHGRKSSNQLPHNTANNSTSIDLYESSDSSTAQSDHQTPSKNPNPGMFNTPLSASKAQTSASSPNSSKRSKPIKQQKSPSSSKLRGMSTETISSEDSIELSPRKSQRRRQVGLSAKPSIASEDDSQPVLASTQRRRRDNIVLDDSDSDAIPLNTTPRLKSKQERLNTTASIQVDDDSAATSSKHRPVSLSSEDEDEDEDDQPIISPLKRRRNATQYSPHTSPAKRNRRPIPVTDDGDDDDLTPPTSRMKSLRRDKGKGRAEEETPTRLTRQKATFRRHRTEKEKKLELLKRRRAGEKIDQLTDSDSSEEEKAALYDSGAGNEFLSDFPDESENEIIEKAPEPSRRRTSSRRDKENDEDDDDGFIVDDDEEMLGVPPVSLQDIPLEFTHAAHKPLKEHFRDAVEWMVHMKINPGFKRDDPIYVNAFKKLDDEVSGYARSKFLSAAWNEDFSKAITSRPTIEVAELPVADHLRKCSACNRSGHPSTYIITLSGHPYHKETLEEVDQDDSEEDDSRVSINSQGQDLPPDGKEWYVGSTCASNAEWAHRLSHWKYELNEWVVDNLRGEGYLSGEELAKKERLKSREKREYANAIVDKWENEGTIRSLYTDFKRNMEAARATKTQRYGRR